MGLLTWDLFAGVTSKLLLFRLASYGDALPMFASNSHATRNTKHADAILFDGLAS